MTPTVYTPTDGVSFLAITDNRFTTARISVSIYLPLREDTAAANAVVPFLLSRGTAAFDDMTMFNRELSRLYGASLSANVSGAGETQIVSLAMSCLDDRFALDGNDISAQCASLLLDVLFDPPLENGVFRTEDVKQECRCTLESIAAEINDKRRYAVAKCKALLCAGEPYAVSKYGTKETVEALTPKDITDAWHQMLLTAPMRIVYQGSGDGRLVREAFAARLTDRRVQTLPPVVKHAPKSSVARQSEQMDVNQCQLVMGWHTEVSEDHALCDAMRLAVAVFGGTPHSLLFRHVREEHSLCYYCISRYDRQKGVMLVESGVDVATLEQAQAEILHQLDVLKSGGFSDEDIENARRSMLDSLLAAGDSAAALSDWYSVQGPTRMRTPQETADGIRAVTREQLLAAAATLTLDCVFTLIPEDKEATA